MTDSSNITESSQQNGKVKPNANPSVLLQRSSAQRVYYLLPAPSSLGHYLVRWLYLILHPDKNYSLSTLSQNISVSKLLTKMRPLRPSHVWDSFPLNTHVTSFLQKSPASFAANWFV